jgi:hypothetical protein
MRFSRGALAVALLVPLVRCGGAVGSGSEPGDADAACIASDPACPPTDGGGADRDAAPEPGDGASDGSDASDAPPCPLPDGSGYQCDPLAKCGCGFGQACDLITYNASEAKEGAVCRPAGIAKPYTYCAQDEDCRPGFTCILENCRRLCATDAECDGVDPYRRCMHFKTLSNGFGQSQELPYGHCVAACDPAWPKSDHDDPTFVACGPGLQCQPVLPALVDGATWLTHCIFWSDKPRLGWGAPCKQYAECEPGFACEQEPVDGGLAEPGPGERFCRKWCHVGSQCNDKPCTPVGRSAGPIELGLCPL